MSLLDDYEKQLAQLRADVNNITHTKLADGLLDAITNSAEYRVYGDQFHPKEYGRRYSFMNENLYGVKRKNMSIEIEALQSGNSDYENYFPGHIVNIVESGGPWQWTNAKELPGPRPFMQEGLNDYVDGGFAEAALVEALRARGYIVK